MVALIVGVNASAAPQSAVADPKTTPATTARATAGTTASHPVALRLERLWEREKLPSTAFAGLTVLDPETGQTLFSRNGEILFTPASNAKLYSTAFALSTLGPDHRFETELRIEGEYFDSGGILRGDLALIGKGDPSIGARAYPYSRDGARNRDPALSAMEAFADAAHARGIRLIEGDVIGDDSAYLWEPFREGWAQDDALHEFGAPVSALTLHDSAVRLTIRPGSQNELPAEISVQPAVDYFDIINEIRTVRGAPARVTWERVPGQRLLLLRGELPPDAPPRSIRLAVDDPALFAATYLRDALIRRGIVVRGAARARHRFPAEHTAADDAQVPSPDTLVHLRLSPPLSDLVAVVNKESQNLHAELLLLEVARTTTGVGSRTAAMAALRRFLVSEKVPVTGLTLADASGLARLNLVSPDSTAMLLAAMWRGNHRDVWVASLPVGGQDGTLGSRFAGNPLAAAVSAKTGTLRGVAALAGYVRTRSGKTLVFSAVVNNHGGPGYVARAFLDMIAMEIAGTP